MRNSEDIEAHIGMRLGGLESFFADSRRSCTSGSEGCTPIWELVSVCNPAVVDRSAYSADHCALVCCALLEALLLGGIKGSRSGTRRCRRYWVEYAVLEWVVYGIALFSTQKVPFT